MGRLGCLARAKVNLTLDILSRRPDGFHDIESVVQTLSLADEVHLEKIPAAGGISLRAEGDFRVPEGAGNLAYRGAEAFMEALCARDGRDARFGASLRLVKRVPAEAGLGGGSSDAAAVLHLMNEAAGRPFGMEELAGMAGGLGSDVPYLLSGGLALIEGRGTEAEALDGADMGGLGILLAKPAEGLSTAAMYAAWDMRSERSGKAGGPTRSRRFIGLLGSGDIGGALGCAGNDFEDDAERLLPEIAGIKAAMLSRGASVSSMSGSGSAVFGIFGSLSEAEGAASAIKEMFGGAFVAAVRANGRRGVPMIG